MAEHRVPMLGTSLLPRRDPTRSRDPRVRSVVAQLAVLPAPPVRPEFRADLRAQLVAIAPRLVAEGDAEAAPAGRAATARASVRGIAGAQHAGVGVRAGSLAFALPRSLSRVAAVAVVLTLVLSGALLLSRNALPGDALYGLKLGSERVQLAFDTTDAATADDYLHFATNRVHEIDALQRRVSALPADPGGVSAAGVKDTSTLDDQIRAALQRADSDTKDGSALLDKQATRDGQAAPLRKLTAWATQQHDDIFAIWNQAPPKSAIRTRMFDSLTIVDNIKNSAQQQLSKLSTGCSGTANPCSGTPSPGSTSTPTTHRSSPAGPGRSTRPGGGGGGPGGGGGSSGSGGGGGGAPGGGTSGSSSSSAGGGGGGAGGSTPSTTPTSSARPSSSPSAAARPTKGIGGMVSRVTSAVPSVGASVGSCTVSAGIGPVQLTASVCSPTP